MNNEYYVYLYCYPDEPKWFYDFSLGAYINKPFYVGKGKGNRDISHLNETQETTINLFKFRIIEKLRNNNSEPVIIRYQDHITSPDAYSLEQELILLFGRRNAKELGVLSNISSGGDCGPVLYGEDNGFYGKTHSIETRKTISNNTSIAMRRPAVYNKFMSYIRYRNISGNRNPMFNKTIYGQWVSKFGEEEANHRMSAYRKTMSASTTGKRNGRYNKTTNLEQIKQLVLSGMSLAKIQKQLGIGRSCLENRLTELHIPIPLPLRKEWILNNTKPQ